MKSDSNNYNNNEISVLALQMQKELTKNLQ